MLCHNGVLVSLICDLPRTHSLALFTIDATVKAHGVLCAYVAERSCMIVDIRGAVFILKMVQCFAIITIKYDTLWYTDSFVTGKGPG